MPEPNAFCPYVGLQPYTEADRLYFFGRDRDQRIIVSNLYAAPLTVLYGASGAGKSSVLLAGVVPRLRATPRTAVVVFREWQGISFLDRLKAQCIDAVAVAQQKPLTVDLKLPFDDLLRVAAEAFGGSILILFDQFEEYFLYHPESETNNMFDSEFARAINRDEVDASFLIALREDGLSKLDRFRARIPNLLGNMLRLQHMDAAAAEEAIRKPLEVYNVHSSVSAAPISIEDRLVQTILTQVRTGQVLLSQSAGVGKAQSRNETVQIEAPFLQLVMTRLWDEEMKENSRVLRLSTLERLGGAQDIVRTHLDGVMAKMDLTEREVCSRFFDRLVTPSGSKIACSVEDLTKWSGNLATQVPVVLKTLSDNRILRNVAVPDDQQAAPRSEIFHDVLAPAILDWRQRYQDQQEKIRIQKEEQERHQEERAEVERQREIALERAWWWRFMMYVVALVAVAITGFAVLTYQAKQRAQEAEKNAQKAEEKVENLKALTESQLREASNTKSALTMAIEENKKRPFAIGELFQFMKTNSNDEGTAASPPSATEEVAAPPLAPPPPPPAAPAIAAPLPAPPPPLVVAASQTKELTQSVTPLKPRVYIQIQDDSQKEETEKIREKLKKAGFLAPDIEQLDAGPSTNTEVRFFRKEEDDGAKKILQVLQESGVTDVATKFIPGYEDSKKMRANHYEVWFAPNAFQGQ